MHYSTVTVMRSVHRVLLKHYAS